MASRFHILVVEDDPLVLDTLQMTLEGMHRVSLARTMEQACAVLRTSHVDVALIDRVLPDGRGSEVAVIAEAAGAAVIEMTGYPPESVGLDARERPYLMKPFQVDVLLSTVADLLHDRSMSGGRPRWEAKHHSEVAAKE
jgi:DNA-binding NtrC family response regulator